MKFVEFAYKMFCQQMYQEKNMDLEFGSEYNDFIKEVQDFCKEYGNATITTNNDKKFEMHDALSGTGSANGDTGKTVIRSDWQRLLIEKGYFARSIPKEYGGYGGEPDIIKSRIIATEFSKHKVPNAMGGQGIDMLVPTLLEWGTEEQKQKYIKSTLHGETIWCQGYSEPNAGSDLANLQTKGAVSYTHLTLPTMLMV